MDIALTNSLTRRKEAFAPIDPESIRLYLCGPTVYDRAHLGNARPVLVFDVLVRLLRHVFGADHVTYVRNFTDVDDKINATALQRQQAGAPGTLEALVRERSDETIAWYRADMAALGALTPDHEPRATEYIAQMVTMIETLVADGFAYAKEGHVLFRVREFSRYGALSGRSVDDMIAGARVEVAPFKEDPMDFVLWKPSDDALPGWESPWGRGRPGWHIECSAMAKALLGPEFDIHGGGNDLMFPHHENEIAQSCCANGTQAMARVWLHNEMLQVEGKKMSKSLGNFFTVRDLLDQGIPGEVIRFVMLSTHYRKPMDWTAEKARDAQATLTRWKALTSAIPGDAASTVAGEPVPQPILAALANDLNTHLAFAEMQKLAKPARHDERAKVQLARAMAFMGFDWQTPWEPAQGQTPDGSAGSADLARFETALAEARDLAMRTKDFSCVDRLKTALVAAGVEVRMSKEGVELVPGPDFDAQALEALR
ncbi:cysteine--tRNA ligase [Cognatishimia sp. F0-27]|uniref:cysteine--tRNA ligase n=1 Tax=Cognatishimia sp. F0-27 TaxID=2816855 RepID=UPI001D0C0D94|nr:cysteine--tRNA ligase [Cognatishimia sp. F0-27]MCC1491620.1 cysteine--tRNA ligase [Cognatishimia sp. F0-27]